MTTLLQDIRFALRMIARAPGFTAIVVVTLALGIGANTAIFSVVNAAVLRPLPFPNAGRLAEVYHRYTKYNLPFVTVSPSSYQYIRDHSKSFEQFAAYTGYRAPQNLTGSGDPQRVRAVSTTWNLFDVLGTGPMLGRKFLKADDVPGGRTAILSEALWRTKFGGDQSIVGHDITLDGANYTVIGVMPKGFEFPAKAQLWVPLGLSAEEMANGGSEYLNTVGLMHPDISRQQLNDDMRAMTQEELQMSNDNSNVPGWSANAMPLREITVKDMRSALWVLLAAVGCVLLIACANVANLLLARATSRQKEIAIRAALGADRWRLLRQLLTEGVLLGLMGGFCGLAAAYWSLSALISVVPVQIPSYIHIGIDRNVMIFTVALGMITGVLFSVLPGLQVTRQASAETLKQGSRTAAGAGSPRMRNAIVMLQLAFAVVLLISAGLLIKTFIRLQEANFGFDVENVLTAQLGLPKAQYHEPAQRVAFYSQLLERMRTIPGVRSAAVTNSVPLYLAWASSFNVEGKIFDLRPHAHAGSISGDYFATMRIPLKSGRTFNASDTADSLPVVIVDENLVRAYFGDEDPLGKRLLLSLPEMKRDSPYTIVGVVGAVKHNSPLENETKGQFYLPYTQMPLNGMMVTLRTDVPPMTLAHTLRDQVRAIDPTLPLEEVKPMEEILSEFVAQPRFNMLLIAVFGGLALLLSAIGVYGVMAYSVTQRTHEIGVRMALGAKRQDVLHLILRQAVKLAVVGLGVGVVGALIATRALSSLLFHVRPADPTTFIGITLLLAAITVIAGLVPAMRATRIDPLVALRYE